LLTVAAWLVACDSGKPRSYEFFMDDGIAREGVLARCNQDREASARDAECDNARRAAATLAAGEDRRSAASLEQESARKLSALRDRQVREQEAEQEAADAAKAAAAADYDAHWRDKNPQADAADSETETDDRFAERESLSQLPTRPELKVAAVAPPRSEIKLEKPEIEQAAIAPRPFRTADATDR
jgi:hypothetical protein